MIFSVLRLVMCFPVADLLLVICSAAGCAAAEHLSINPVPRTRGLT